MEKTGDEGRGTMLLATVRGDVHDIGKNLVDIILTNNGYRVVNIGIKQTVNQIIDLTLKSTRNENLNFHEIIDLTTDFERPSKVEEVVKENIVRKISKGKDESCL
jgi:cobalamin-dependent methionine synthase I